ncbi:MAG: translation initiation factor IF-2 [Clostridia bacterium]|nr:translation initiation factor IF-2 [Clostridia bacterium]
MIKYRVHEVAKDFERTSKQISEILGEFGMAPKNNQKVLEEQELDIIFAALTQRNQVEDLGVAVAATRREEPAPVAEEKPADAPAAAAPEAAAPAAPAAPAETAATPETPAAAAPAPEKKPKEHVPRQQPQKRVVNTRVSNVDLRKYDERIDELVPERAFNANSKEKIKKQNQNDRRPAPGSKRRNAEAEKLARLRQQEAAKKAVLKVSIPDEITVAELASRLKKTGAEVVKKLVRNGIMASLGDVIDFDTASLIAMEYDAKIEKEVHLTIEERLIDVAEDAPEQLEPRAPVVVVMGHVDHGKTSILDAIKKTQVAAGEAGGITQHIGAYRVEWDGKPITFLDTPGHEAFTAMRARGASITDIAILVVAADDGIMPQTVEAINHAKAAKMPIIVAVNKMDKPEANPDRVMQQLTEYELLPEEWGGDTIVCKVSAHTGEGLPNLLEMLLLTAEMQELKANPNRAASGTVVEARLDKGRGPIATLLVQNGTLHAGDIVIAGKSVGRVRAMKDDKGKTQKEAGPSVPVEIIGMAEVPGAGDVFNVVSDERMARELAEQRKEEEKAAANAPVVKGASLDDIFSQIQEGIAKSLNLIVKADVQGSLEAVRASLEKLSNEEVKVKVIHGGVGGITESDVMLAKASNAVVIGFNVRPDSGARDSAAQSGVEIRTYRIIYECVEEMEAAIKGMLAPKYRENILGHAEVRQTFHVSGVGTIAGCMVREGKITRSSRARIVRDGVVIYEAEIASLKRFKDDAREVAQGYECGIGVEKFNDIKEGDIIESFVMEEIKD